MNRGKRDDEMKEKRRERIFKRENSRKKERNAQRRKNKIDFKKKI